MAAPLNDMIHPPQAGEQSVFQSIIEAHQALVFSVCLRMLGNWHEAQDLTQEVFFKAYRALPQLRGEAKVSTWLYRIAVNLCLNHQRRRKRERWLSLDWLFEQGGGEQAAGVPAAEETPATALAQQEKEGLVQAAMRLLPEKQRVALVLSVYERLSYQEIAEVMGCSLASVESRLHRAKENLAKTLCDQLK